MRENRSSTTATVLRVRKSPRAESAQVCCCVDFSSIIPRWAIAGYKHKANENVVTYSGICDGRNFIVTHPATAVPVEHVSAGAKIGISLKTTADRCNDPSAAG
jgi:hypothetical protein